MHYSLITFFLTVLYLSSLTVYKFFLLVAWSYISLFLLIFHAVFNISAFVYYYIMYNVENWKKFDQV